MCMSSCLAGHAAFEVIQKSCLVSGPNNKHLVDLMHIRAKASPVDTWASLLLLHLHPHATPDNGEVHPRVHRQGMDAASETAVQYTEDKAGNASDVGQVV